tara:strand:+ start:742 stop:1533 length:792 start_codon:yes stop_codon:yes gene_type:complete
MKQIHLLLAILILTGCSKSLIPLPVSIVPERNNERLPQSSYGEYPSDYQKILKDYLQNNLLNHEDAKVEFVNTPAKLSISQLAKDTTGYRVCLSINARNNKSVYTGYKTHLFMLNNGEVKLHLFDSGLLKIPFNLCVVNDESKSIYLKEIPDIEEEVLIDQMDEIELKEPAKRIINDENIYILCDFVDLKRTFVFNEQNNIFSESKGINEFLYENIKFSTTHILGSNSQQEILINRVSGEAIVTEVGQEAISGNCSLLKDKKF